MAWVSHTWHERALTFPCSRFIPPHVVFRWLCQMRVAPYSYDWIDNFGHRSPPQLTKGLEELAIGQEVMRIFELVDFARDQHLTLRIKRAHLAYRFFGDVAASYCTLANEERACRLLVKMVVRYPRGIIGWATRLVLPWGRLDHDAAPATELSDAS